VAIAACLVILCCKRPDGDDAPGSRSLVLISLDTVRADHVGSYGYSRKTSPNLDRLARRGVRFERMIASSPWTLPSHTTILTGRPPVVHGVVSPESVIPSDVVTLAEHLQQQGYETIGVVSAGFVGAHHGIDRGFDEFVELYREEDLDQDGGGPRASDVTDRALDLVSRRAKPDAPVFAFVHFFDPHWPYRAPDGWHGRFEYEYEGPDIVKPLTVIEDGLLTPQVHDHLVASYDAEIRYVDEEIGRLLKGLDDAGLAGAMISVTSDHGEEFLDHHNYDHGHTLHRESLHVPWILAQHGRNVSSATVPQLAAGKDVAPTVLGLLGLPELPGATGHDWGPLLRGEPSPARAPFLCDNTRSRHIQLAVYDPDSENKLFVELDRDRLTMYALDSDWSEQFDLAEAQPAETARLFEQLPLKQSVNLCVSVRGLLLISHLAISSL